MDKFHKFDSKMTELKNNPKRYKDVRFTKYFGGLVICYYDEALHKHFTERVYSQKELDAICGKPKVKGLAGGNEDDGESDSILESSRNSEE